MVVGSLSKAYELSGLRIGWVVAPEDLVADLWRRHEYATISAASLSMRLAELALTEPRHTQLLQRQRQLAATGRATLLDWVRAHPDLVALEPPASTALGFPRLLRHPDSVAAATAIRDDVRCSYLSTPASSSAPRAISGSVTRSTPARTPQPLIASPMSSRPSEVSAWRLTG